jgi:pyruvate kinase
VLNDARIRLALLGCESERVSAEVVMGGRIEAHKAITFSASEMRVETFSPKDQAILARAGGLPFVRFAISYIKDGPEMQAYRDRAGGAYLAAKLERGSAMADVSGIAAAADELWLCRGDLGAEVGLPGMARAAHQFTGQVGALKVPCLLAGQVLEHMSGHPQPTRSEVSCLYDALQAGYGGCVLSDEVAIGRYPVEACRAAGMFKIF